MRVPRPRLSKTPRLLIAGLCYWLQHVVACMRAVESGRARTCGRDCVRKGCGLVYSLISCCACILSSGSHIIMSRPEDTIALVVRWYEENMRKPFGTKGRHSTERMLAQKWHALLKHKSSLRPSVLVEVETLHEKFQYRDVTPWRHG